jgi:hypothetical protein
VHDAQSAGFKLQLSVIAQLAIFIGLKRVGILTYTFIHLAHALNLMGRYAGAHQEIAMFFIFEPADAMSSLPRVDQHLSVLSFVTHRAR